MKTIVTTRVGADGILMLSVPLGASDANKAVRVTVETVEEASVVLPPTDREAWLRFLERTAGSITDPTFERPAQGDYEERDALS
jgi:hypothetical protein